MNAATRTIDDLLATLTAAEASLRVAAAAYLSPGALMRVERTSTQRARQAVAGRSVDRTLELPTGWAEFVEVDAQIDALLARLAPTAAAPLPPPPGPVPTVAAAPAPAEVLYEQASPAPDDDDWYTSLPEADFDDFDDDLSALVEDDAPPAFAKAPADEISYVSFAEPPVLSDPLASGSEADEDEDEEATVIAPLDDVRAAVAELRGAAAEDEPLTEREAQWSDAQFVKYREASTEQFAEADRVAASEATKVKSEPVSYITYTEDPVVPDVPDEDLPDWARPRTPGDEAEAEVKAKPAPKATPKVTAKAAVPEEPMDPDAWNFVGAGHEASQEDEAEAADPYAVTRRERMRLDDFTTVHDAEPEPEVETEVVEAAPVTASISAATDDRPHAAAIQLSADGAKVLGADDEDDEDKVIELGDTRDYGDEEVMEDDQTGILGVGVLEYDDVEEIEEIEEVDEDPHSLAHLPGAPELTPAEVNALFGKAEEISRKNMARGVQLYGDVLDADPTRVDALLARGRIQLDLGDFPGSVSDFLKAEALQPRDPDVQVALGDLFYGRKDYGKAVSYFNRALSIDGDHATALARRGMAHYYRRQYNAAVEDLERAKKLDPALAHVDTYISRARKRT